MSDYLKTIKQEIETSAQVKQQLLADTTALERIDAAAQACVAAYRAGHKTLWAGNGGSAADAQHMAGEMVSRFAYDRPGLPSMALTTDTSILTAIGNDYGFEQLFKRQLEANAQAGDVLIGLSTSGNSRNLAACAQACRDRGVVSIALTGANACAMDDWDIVIKVPSTVTPRIQECHTLIGHILCGIIEREMFPRQ